MRTALVALLVVFTMPVHAGVPEADFIRGDANGDQQLDISDGRYINRYLFLGGPAPGSFDSADTDNSGAINITDAIFDHNYLFLGGPAPPAPFPSAGPDTEADGLSSIAYPTNVVSQGSSYTFSGPSQVTGPAGIPVEIPVSVLLTAEGDVGGWSVGVEASGNGSIESATTDGTVGADASDGGLRNTGFERTDLAGGGGVSAVDLSFTMPIALPDSSENTVLKLTLGGVFPAGGSSEFWDLSFVDTIQGTGQAVRNIVSVDGLSFEPSLGTYRVEVTGEPIPEPAGAALASFALGLLAPAVGRWRRRTI